MLVKSSSILMDSLSLCRDLEQWTHIYTNSLKYSEAMSAPKIGTRSEQKYYCSHFGPWNRNSWKSSTHSVVYCVVLNIKMWRKIVQKVIKNRKKLDKRDYNVAVKRGSVSSICRRATVHSILEVRSWWMLLYAHV